MFNLDVVTLFPEVFAPFVGLSIVGRAVDAGVVTVAYHHLLDELRGSERADDSPFGGVREWCCGSSRSRAYSTEF